MNVVLTGFMGTGKSSVGRALARRLGLKYLDTDDLIEKKAGMSIPDIFETGGEPRFRALEREVIKGLDIVNVSDEATTGIVLSTGGGAILDKGNRALLRAFGIVICLKASVDTILRRVGAGDERPLLKNGHDNGRASIESLLRERAVTYAECDLELDTTDKDIDEVVDNIVDFIEEGPK